MSPQNPPAETPPEIRSGHPSEDSAVWLPAEQLIDQSPDGGVAVPETFPQQVDAESLGPPDGDPDDDSDATEHN